MLIPLYVLGAISLTLLGFGGNIVFIYVLVAIAGASTIGAQNLIQAYVSQYYPAVHEINRIRHGLWYRQNGRNDWSNFRWSLLASSLPIHLNFIAFAIPGVIAALALALVSGKEAYDKKQTPANGERTKESYQQSVEEIN